MARQHIVTGLFLVALIHVTMSTRVQEYFPEIKNNLTKIQWSHATNTKALLQAAINSSEVHMIEADVTMGYKKYDNGTTNPQLTVIMGHPPVTSSDLTLEEFLRTVFSANLKNATKKGIKLDFKSIEAFDNATQTLSGQVTRAPVWLNADVLKGPVNADEPVNAKRFVTGAQKLSILKPLISIGWTTKYVAPAGNDSVSGNYTKEQIQEMIKLVNETYQPDVSITYPVRACYAANDIEAMKTLLAGTPAANNATLTIWSGEADKVDTDKLSLLVRTIGIDKVFVDVPKSILEKLNFNSAFAAKSSVFVVFASMMVALFTAKLL